jgi:hypothetical protein
MKNGKPMIVSGNNLTVLVLNSNKIKLTDAHTVKGSGILRHQCINTQKS